MSIRELKLFNTLGKKKETFTPIEPGKIKFYSCGPTVYGHIHIGNLRTAIVSDMFFRYFKRIGYDVKFARNYTDVDDKIIKLANNEGVEPSVITKKYIEAVEKDYQACGMLEPTFKPLVTDTIPEIIAFIEDILKNDHAYVTKDNEVIYSVASKKDYGKLSGKNIEELEAGARVEINDQKKDPLDFILWKPAKPGEMCWDSPWGKGRPGWHIECSAMIRSLLGDQIDIHHGAIDLIFTHHENEIAQSEAATHKTPFVKVWMHNAFLNMSNQKMSKSLGNILTATEFLKTYNGEIARYISLSVHYRSAIDFDNSVIEKSIGELQRIYSAKEKALSFLKSDQNPSDEVWKPFIEQVESARIAIDNAFANDFNTPDVLAILFSTIRSYNSLCGNEQTAQLSGHAKAASSLIKLIEEDVGGILGVGLLDPKSALLALSQFKAKLSGNSTSRPNPDEIEALIVKRLEARKSKDFHTSDAIRDDLLKKGVLLKDGPKGTTWEYQ